MKLPPIYLRDLFWLTIVVALGFGWFFQATRARAKFTAQSAVQRKELEAKDWELQSVHWKLEDETERLQPYENWIQQGGLLEVNNFFVRLEREEVVAWPVAKDVHEQVLIDSITKAKHTP